MNRRSRSTTSSRSTTVSEAAEGARIHAVRHMTAPNRHRTGEVESSLDLIEVDLRTVAADPHLLAVVTSASALTEEKRRDACSARKGAADPTRALTEGARMGMIAILGGVMLVGALAGAIVARRRIWGLRLRPPVANPMPPTGSVLLATYAVRGAGMQLTSVLADWIARGVLEVRRSGPDLPAEVLKGDASGPVWRFVVRDASLLDAVETPLLAALVPDGVEAVLTREDTAARDRIEAAVHAVRKAQRASFGERPTRHILLAVALELCAVLGALLATVGAFVSGDATASAGAVLGSVVVVGVTIALCGSASAPAEAERNYRQRVLDIGEWVRTTESPNTALAGWAMLWDLPGAWAAAMPDEISGLRFRDRSFMRGDAARRNLTEY